MQNNDELQHIYEAMQPPETPQIFAVGDKVKLRPDVLVRHFRSVPAHMGFTREQFAWRDTLRNIKDEVGIIDRVFENSKHVNVKFKNHLIGIDNTELEKVGQ